MHDKIEGPFDLIELAGLFKEGAIDGDTPIRTEDTEDWRPLRERSEYGSIQGISIEAIARHLHEKERAGQQTQHFGKNSFGFWWVLVGCSIALIGLIIFWPQAQPQPVVAPAPPPPTPQVVVEDDWPRTIGDHFSVNSPTPLQWVRPDGSNMVSYRGYIEGARFGLDVLNLPGHSDAEYQQVVDEVQSMFLERQRHASAQQETTISGPGYQGQEISFNVVVDTFDEKGKVRFVFGKGNIVTVWVIAKPDKFGAEDIDRFLTSLEVR